MELRVASSELVWLSPRSSTLTRTRTRTAYAYAYAYASAYPQA